MIGRFREDLLCDCCTSGMGLAIVKLVYAKEPTFLQQGPPKNPSGQRGVIWATTLTSPYWTSGLR